MNKWVHRNGGWMGSGKEQEEAVVLFVVLYPAAQWDCFLILFLTMITATLVMNLSSLSLFPLSFSLHSTQPWADRFLLCSSWLCPPPYKWYHWSLVFLYAYDLCVYLTRTCCDCGSCLAEATNLEFHNQLFVRDNNRLFVTHKNDATKYAYRLDYLFLIHLEGRSQLCSHSHQPQLYIVFSSNRPSYTADLLTWLSIKGS